MKGVHFYGGGFKTMYYFKFVKKLIKKQKMPKYYSGTSSGALVACLCLALSSVKSRSERKSLLNKAMTIIKLDLISATAPIYLNFTKCSCSVNVIANICRSIQPNIEKYNNFLNINITRISGYTIPFGYLHQITKWNNWDELKLDLCAGSSIPGIQDYLIRKDSEGYLSIDGAFRGENLPKLYVKFCEF